MIKVGVTGSNGFIGWHLCQTLRLDSNKYVVIEFNREWFNEDKKLDIFVSKCDVIIHLAGLNRHSEDEVIYNTNIGLAEKLIESFNRTGFKGQVLFSSSIQEERNNIFGNSKKLAKELFYNWAINAEANFKGLLIPNVFGAFGKPFYNSVVSTFCHQLVNNETPKIENDVTLNLIYINDLIKVVIDLIDVKTIENINISYTDSYKVSEILELLLAFKLKYYEKGQIPNFNKKFELNLFNTFRSYFDLNGHFPIKYTNNIDDRGNFVEVIKLEIGGQVSFSTTKKGITRGNHFHTRKVERFSVIKGEALIQLRKVGDIDTFDYYLSGAEPAYVDMPIWYTHNIKNIGKEDLYTVFWINEFYNPNDPDTYFEIV
ncbi:SDR family oxidoreductase [Aquirufa antheringensis]|uniref:SDR family oxidoreductase n=1 Tax=Aquirufa antheringensis TaxID=2516559 RepID=A0A4Q9BFM5_9BACT|nr:NAD-dependent epimerase/dehydratase family protein [Aquirufa antheringensis]TBH75050.1 SDR family oxidoreductase [Aquirufa antheringensis]